MDEKRRRIETFLIPPIELLADREYQQYTWVNKTNPDPIDYSELIEMLSHEFHCFLDLECSSDLKKEQRKLLSELKDSVEAFDWNVGDEEFRDMSLIVDNPEWEAIRKKAKAFLEEIKNG